MPWRGAAEKREWAGTVTIPRFGMAGRLWPPRRTVAVLGPQDEKIREPATRLTERTCCRRRFASCPIGHKPSVNEFEPGTGILGLPVPNSNREQQFATASLNGSAFASEETIA